MDFAKQKQQALLEKCFPMRKIWIFTSVRSQMGTDSTQLTIGKLNKCS